VKTVFAVMKKSEAEDGAVIEAESDAAAETIHETGTVR